MIVKIEGKANCGLVNEHVINMLSNGCCLVKKNVANTVQTRTEQITLGRVIAGKFTGKTPISNTFFIYMHEKEPARSIQISINITFILDEIFSPQGNPLVCRKRQSSAFLLLIRQYFFVLAQQEV